jgi:hypothetical protein
MMCSDHDESDASIETIRLEDVRSQYDQDTVARLLEYGRHRCDDFGEYWVASELAEIIELDDLESRLLDLHDE